MISSRLYFFLFVLLLGSPLLLPLRAQEIEDDGKIREFTALGYGDSLFEDVCFKQTLEDGIEKVCLEFFPNRKSPRYAIDGDTTELEFFSTDRDAKGREVRKERGRVQLPAGDSKLLLLFEASDSYLKDGLYSITVVDESSDHWGAGCFRFLNLTGSQLFCRIGAVSGELNMGLSEVVRFPVEKRTPIPLQFSVVWEGKKRIIYATDTLPDANVGKLIVIKPPRDPDSLRIRVATIW